MNYEAHPTLNQSLSIMIQLELESIVLVFDQALYAKASKVKWKHMDRFDNLSIFMGTFHTIGTLLNIIGKRFGDAGLQDLCIESLVVAEGSILGLVEGKKYNHAVRVHKLVYEAMHRLAWKSFTEHSDGELIQEFATKIEKLTTNVNEDSFQSTLEHPVFVKVVDLYEDHLNFLRNNNGLLSKFWMTYFDLVGILFNFLRASRTGDWGLHLASVRSMLPLCFAYDATNYARYMSVYYQDMTTLNEEHPDAHEFLQHGGFSVQMSASNPFGRIPVTPMCGGNRE